MDISIKKCTLDEIDILIKLSKACFYETFSADNSEDDMKTYLENAFAYDKIKSEILNENSQFYLLFSDDKLAAYLKLNEYLAQTEDYDKDSLEIERIYVAKEFQGLKLGQVLMDKAVKIALDLKKSYVWLGVWENNKNAIAFYEKNGFSVIDTHYFRMGDSKQCDYIMKKPL